MDVRAEYGVGMAMTARDQQVELGGVNGSDHLFANRSMAASGMATQVGRLRAS